MSRAHIDSFSAHQIQIVSVAARDLRGQARVTIDGFKFHANFKSEPHNAINDCFYRAWMVNTVQM